jgi:CRISPR-associated endonuclease/helicase Cas3
MASLNLQIKPVYSALAEEAESARYTGALRLMQHQVETLKAYDDPSVEIIFNTAMTGDGKTLAAFLPAFLHNKNALASYPTNELIRDQFRSLQLRQGQFNYPGQLGEMHSAEISRLMAENEEESRPDMVKNLVDKTDLLLTNPDLFHLLMSNQYGWFQRREFSQRLQANYYYYIFDEFHIFQPPQVISVMNIINAVTVERRKTPADRRRKFLFLSATPDPLMKQMLQATGLNYLEITGQYRDDLPHNLAQNCTLHLEPVNRDSGGPEKWVVNHIDEILDFFAKYPGSKGALIVSSVAVARRLVKALKPQFEARLLTISENTGLTGRPERIASFQADLLIGTSTIDIGVDFQINFLIFEANSAADFLQRFGRLGRHPGYIKDGHEIKFDPASYQAYALCPPYICERIKKRLEDTGVDAVLPISRPAFNRDVITHPCVFFDRQQFRFYASRWGLLQAAPFIAHLETAKYDRMDNYGEFREDLLQQFAISFGTTNERVKSKVYNYHALARDEKKKELLKEINSFRGSSLSCGVWDTTDGELKTYSLLYILANSKFEIISEDQFMAQVRREGKFEYSFKYQLLYLKVLEYLPESDSFNFKLPNHNFGKGDKTLLNTAQVIKGFRVDKLRQPNVGEVNAILKNKPLVCTITGDWQKPADLKSRLNLPLLFPVYSLGDNISTGYCVSFGKEALLLDSLLFYRKNKNNEGAILDFELTN